MAANIGDLFPAGCDRDVTINPLLGVVQLAELIAQALKGEIALTDTGVVSGPGNQGSAATSMLQGHAGTPASQTGVPRQLKIGAPSLLGTV